MSRIQALDEITARLGPPALLRWVNAPYGATAAVVRLRHRGAVVDLSASGVFRLIFQLSSSRVVRGESEAAASQEAMRAGSIVTSCTQQPERIRVLGSAETLHLLYSPELAAASEAGCNDPLPQVRRALQALAAQTLVAVSLSGTDEQLQQAVASVAKLIVEQRKEARAALGGFAPQVRRAVLDRLDERVRDGISVPELAEAAHLSLHHFIRVCRQSEGLTSHALLTQKRIEHAVELLLHRTASVEEIAMLVGFSSPSHCVSTFRRVVGVTPAALRRAARG